MLSVQLTGPGAWGAEPGDLVVVDMSGTVRDKVELKDMDLRMPFAADDLESRIEVYAFDPSPVLAPETTAAK